MNDRSHLRAGHPFNPHGVLRGVFVPLGVLGHPSLSDGAKLLYARLCFAAGRSGECAVSVEELAAASAASEPTVKRQLHELTGAGLIRRIRRGPGLPAVCVFLWHECLADSLKRSPDGSEVIRLEGSKVIRQDRSEMIRLPADGSKMSYQGQMDQKRAVKTDQICTADGSDLSHLSLYSVLQNSTEDSSSTTSPTDEGLANWDAEDVVEAREAMRAFRGVGTLPDPIISRKILAGFESLTDLRACLQDLAERVDGRTVRSYAYLVSVAAEWPERRRELAKAAWEAQELARRAAQGDREGAGRAECHQQRSEPTACAECAGSGLVTLNPAAPIMQQRCRFCECAAGERKRREEPGIVDRLNAIADRFAARKDVGRETLAAAVTAALR